MIRKCITCGREVDPGNPFSKCDNCIANENQDEDVTWTRRCCVCRKDVEHFQAAAPKHHEPVTSTYCQPCYKAKLAQISAEVKEQHTAQ